MSRSNPSSSSVVFKAFAVVLAIGVVGYLVYRAQQGAEPGRADAPQQPAAESGAGDEPVLLPSSKDAVLPSSKFDVLDEQLLFSSKSGRVPVEEVQPAPLLPSSKVIVIPDEAQKEEMKKLLEQLVKDGKVGEDANIVEVPSMLSSSKSIVIPEGTITEPKKKEAAKDGAAKKDAADQKKANAKPGGKR